MNRGARACTYYNKASGRGGVGGGEESVKFLDILQNIS